MYKTSAEGPTASDGKGKAYDCLWDLTIGKATNYNDGKYMMGLWQLYSMGRPMIFLGGLHGNYKVISDYKFTNYNYIANN